MGAQEVMLVGITSPFFSVHFAKEPAWRLLDNVALLLCIAGIPKQDALKTFKNKNKAALGAMPMHGIGC